MADGRTVGAPDEGKDAKTLQVARDLDFDYDLRHILT